MDEPISARYVWDVEAMTEALAAYQRQSIRPFIRLLSWLLMLCLLFASVFFTTWMMLDSRNPPEIKRNGAIALVVELAVWSWFLDGVRNKRFLRWQARRVFRSKPVGSDLVEWSIGPEEVSSRTQHSASTILWPLFIKVVETPGGFLLFQSIQLFNWIPGHAFASTDALRRFAELARSRVANYVVLGPCHFPAKPEPIGLDEL